MAWDAQKEYAQGDMGNAEKGSEVYPGWNVQITCTSRKDRPPRTKLGVILGRQNRMRLLEHWIQQRCPFKAEEERWRVSGPGQCRKEWEFPVKGQCCWDEWGDESSRWAISSGPTVKTYKGVTLPLTPMACWLQMQADLGPRSCPAWFTPG